MVKMRSAILILLTATTLPGQDAALTRLQHEVSLVKASAGEPNTQPNVAALHRALREWVEARLPADKGHMPERAALGASLRADLADAELSMPAETTQEAAAGNGTFEMRALGTVSIRLTQFPNLPDTLFVTTGAGVPCGVDEAVYGYRFDERKRTAVLQDREEGYSGTKLELSAPDAGGRRLLLVHRTSVQCASKWTGVAFSVYRLGLPPGPAERLLSEKQNVYIGDDELAFVLKPDELMLEFVDRSVDVAVHNRTRIRRYPFAGGARRLDPVAFQPQDFAEEWLTRPWSEMQSRSAPETIDWHSKLHSGFVLGEYSAVVRCEASPGRWMIALGVTHIGEKKLDEPLEAYFLVRDLGSYRYQMESVSEERPAGCPGDASASDKHPWLSPEELRALR
jgi:hypothetical protein